VDSDWFDYGTSPGKERKNFIFISLFCLMFRRHIRINKHIGKNLVNNPVAELSAVYILNMAIWE